MSIFDNIIDSILTYLERYIVQKEIEKKKWQKNRLFSDSSQIGFLLFLHDYIQ